MTPAKSPTARKGVVKIGVLSDTHDRPLPDQVVNDFKQVDIIVHVGDFCSRAVYDALTKIRPVEAVRGNMDNSEMASLLPQKKIFTAGRFRIGLFHGGGPPNGLFDKVRSEFAGAKVDAVIFGHSHKPLNEMKEGVLYFNPGSPTDDVYAPYQSYGIIDVSGDKITGHIIKVK